MIKCSQSKLLVSQKLWVGDLLHILDVSRGLPCTTVKMIVTIK